MPNSNFQQIRLFDPGCWYKVTYKMTNSADPDELASSEANWSGSTLFAKAGYIWVQLDKVKKYSRNTPTKTKLSKSFGKKKKKKCAKWYKNAALAKHCSRPQWLSWMRINLVIRRLRVRPPWGRQHSFVEVDHEIFSMVFLSLPLIQEGYLSVSGEIICTILVKSLRTNPAQ